MKTYKVETYEIKVTRKDSEFNYSEELLFQDLADAEKFMDEQVNLFDRYAYQGEGEYVKGNVLMVEMTIFEDGEEFGSTFRTRGFYKGMENLDVQSMMYEQHAMQEALRFKLMGK